MNKLQLHLYAFNCATTYMIHVLFNRFRISTSIWKNPHFDWECSKNGRDRAMSFPTCI